MNRVSDHEFSTSTAPTTLSSPPRITKGRAQKGLEEKEGRGISKGVSAESSELNYQLRDTQNALVHGEFAVAVL